MCVSLTNINDLDTLILKEFQGHRDVFQFLAAECWAFVVFGHSLLGQHFDQGDQSEAVGQVRLQVVDRPIDGLQVLVGPPGEGVLLDLLPLRILGEIAFGLHVLVKVLLVLIRLLALLSGWLVVVVRLWVSDYANIKLAGFTRFGWVCR